MKEIGAMLYEARTERGLSLEELSEKTRIRVEYLKAVEEGSPEKVPGEAYFRAFVRTYAREMGLDPDALLAQYEMRTATETQITERPSLRERRAAARRRRRMRFLAAAIVLAAAAAAAYWLWTNEFFGKL